MSKSLETLQGDELIQVCEELDINFKILMTRTNQDIQNAIDMYVSNLKYLKSKSEITVLEQKVQIYKAIQRENASYLKRNISINNDNFERVVAYTYKFMCDIWTQIIEEILEKKAGEAPVLYIRDNVDENTAFYRRSTGDFHINKSMLRFGKQYSFNNDICFSVIIAHEIGHYLQDIFNIESNITPVNEAHADFIAGYTLQEMEKRGLTDDNDIKSVLFSWGEIGSEDHGDGAVRQANIMKGYNASIEELKINLERKL